MNWERRPGGAMATRDIHFIWLLDASSSMQANGKIQSLNYAIANALPEMRSKAEENPYARVLVRALKFATRAEWMTPEPVPLHSFEWKDIEAHGQTAMGEALCLVADALDTLHTGGRLYPPVLILVTDGHPTDNRFDEGLRRLLAVPLGHRSQRLAVAIGADADVQRLQEFMGDPAVRPLEARNSDQLAQMIRLVSTTGIELASTPNSRTTDKGRLLETLVDTESGPVVW